MYFNYKYAGVPAIILLLLLLITNTVRSKIVYKYLFTVVPILSFFCHIMHADMHYTRLYIYDCSLA